jgi:hypothetical protein
VKERKGGREKSGREERFYSTIDLKMNIRK